MTRAARRLASTPSPLTPIRLWLSNACGNGWTLDDRRRPPNPDRPPSIIQPHERHERIGRIAAATIVIPCYNEAQRLDLQQLALAIEESPRWDFVFVDDGSTDATARLLDGLREPHPDRVTVLRLASNSGKGEAVRKGMLTALDQGSEIVAYADADLSAPLSELGRLIDRLAADDRLQAVIGARFRRLGADIQRSQMRHLVGRVYATLASAALEADVYDTQCGAKAFRETPQLRESLAEPFSERWSFDVELLSRLARRSGPDPWSGIVEEPLLVWHAKSGSKLGLRAAFLAALELLRIGRRHRRHLRQP